MKSVRIWRRAALAALLSVGFGGQAFGLETKWPNDQNAAGFKLYGLPAPTLGTGALRLQDVAVGACVIAATGVNGTFVCASPSGITVLSPLVSTGGVTPQLSLAIDSTLTLAGGTTLSRGALTGAVTAAAGSNTTAFGAIAGLSVLANATGSSAVPAPLAAGSDGLVMGRFSGALVFHQLVEADVTNLTTDLAGKVPSTRTVSTTAPLTGGGALSGDLTLSLSIDGTSVGVSGGAVQRLALTGAVTSAAGSASTAFGTLAATSVLANATGSTAVPSALAAGSDGIVLGRFAGALTFHQLDESDITSLTTDLAGKAPATRTLTTTGALLCGGGLTCDLSADRTLSLTLDSTLAVATGALGRAATTGDVVIPAASNVATIQPNAVTNAKAAQMAASTIKGNATNATANAQDVAATGANQVPLSTGTGWSWSTVPGASVRADGIATGTVQLSSLAATSLADGTTAYVDSVSAFFKLAQSSLTTDAITVIAASGKAGYQWQRLSQQSPTYWSQTSWTIDPSGGNDENPGTSLSPLKTWAEWARRTHRAQISTAVTVTVVSDMTDADDMVVDLDTIGSGTLTIQGTTSVVATTTVTAAQARTPASNQANEITTSADLSSYVGSLLRVQGTSNYAAIVKSVSSNVVRLGQLYNTSSLGTGSATGVANGATVEVTSQTKGPLRVTVRGKVAPTFQDLHLDGSGSVRWIDSRIGANYIARRIVWGGSATSCSMFSSLSPTRVSEVFRCPIQWLGTSGINGSAFLGTSGVNSIATSGSGKISLNGVVSQGVQFEMAGGDVLILNDLGTFDLAAGKVALHFVSDNPGSRVDYENGRQYGSGNNATSAVWQIDLGSATVISYAAGSAPTMDAGLGVVLSGTSYPLARLPIAYNPWTGVGVVSGGGPAPLSVFGNPTASISVPPVDITASANGDVLRMASGTLGWGAIPEASVTNLTTDLAGKISSSRAFTTTAPLLCDGVGSCDLSANRTLSLSINATLSAAGGTLGRAAISGDGSIPAGSNTFSLTSIPNDTIVVADILPTASAAPATPAAGKGRCWFDSTSKDWTCLGDAGVKTHTAQSLAASSNVFVTGLSDAGALSTATLAAVATSGSATDLTTGTLPDARLSNVITAGTCTNCNLTYDAHGRVTVAGTGRAAAAER
jgi:hypothetical protein